MENKIRWGIVGLGKIANTFAQDLMLVEDAVLSAVASRSLEKAEDFSKKYGSPKTFSDYQSLINSDLVDVVYIATPHTQHREWTLACLEAGKAVLCEKPTGINEGEVLQMIQKAQEKKVFYMEGLWSRFNPTIQDCLARIKNKEIGKTAYIKADFGFYALDRPLDSRTVNLDLAGGSLLDIGIYPIFLSYLIMGMPKQIKTSAQFYEKTGAEIQISMLFEYEKGMAMLYSGLVSNTECVAQISGDKGHITIDARWHESQGYTLVSEGASRIITLPTVGNGFTPEINEVHRCIKAGKIESELWSHQNSLDLIRILDWVRKDSKIEFK